MKILPPISEKELEQRAMALAGQTLGDVAWQWGENTPKDLHRAKGWMGQLIEKALGANAGNLDQPDFIHLGIELKTLPINAQGLPNESTYICTAPIPNRDPTFDQSRVWRKMARILWVPIESSMDKPIAQRRISTPILWSPTPLIRSQLQKDWEELTEKMNVGKVDRLSAHLGEYLQIRPKAANSKTFVQIMNNEGQMISIVPKGFYVRTTLTQQILQEHYFL